MTKSASNRTARITITVPEAALREADLRAPNRSRLFTELLRGQLATWREEELRASLESPHDETARLQASRLDEATWGLPSEDSDGLLDPGGGTGVRWESGKGWRRL